MPDLAGTLQTTTLQLRRAEIEFLFTGNERYSGLHGDLTRMTGSTIQQLEARIKRPTRPKASNVAEINGRPGGVWLVLQGHPGHQEAARPLPAAGRQRSAPEVQSGSDRSSRRQSGRRPRSVVRNHADPGEGLHAEERSAGLHRLRQDVDGLHPRTGPQPAPRRRQGFARQGRRGIHRQCRSMGCAAAEVPQHLPAAFQRLQVAGTAARQPGLDDSQRRHRRLHVGNPSPPRGQGSAHDGVRRHHGDDAGVRLAAGARHRQADRPHHRRHEGGRRRRSRRDHSLRRSPQRGRRHGAHASTCSPRGCRKPKG